MFVVSLFCINKQLLISCVSVLLKHLLCLPPRNQGGMWLPTSPFVLIICHNTMFGVYLEKGINMKLHKKVSLRKCSVQNNYFGLVLLGHFLFLHTMWFSVLTCILLSKLRRTNAEDFMHVQFLRSVHLNKHTTVKSSMLSKCHRMKMMSNDLFK